MIHATAVVHKRVSYGGGFDVGEYVVVGSWPTVYVGFKRVEPRFGIRIGSNVHIGAHSCIVLGYEGDTVIGDDAVLAQMVIVGHDAHVGRKVKLMNSVVLNGHVVVGAHTVIGSGAHVRERVIIGENSVIGMGSVVTRDVPGNVVAYGNPCRVIRPQDGLVKDLLTRWLT